MNIALVLSGGTGSRLGADIPKQYIEVNGRMIIDYCLETFFASEYIDAVWIVAAEGWQGRIRSELKSMGLSDAGRSKPVGFSVPGENRQLSILNGLEDIRRYVPEHRGENLTEGGRSNLNCGKMPEDGEAVKESGSVEDGCVFEGVNVLIHDAARPLLTHRLISDCFEALPGHDGVMPVLPMKDTVYVSHNGQKVDGLLDRGTIYAGQAPELYRLERYYNACTALIPDEILSINGSTEPAIRAGLDVVMIPGDEGNYKITTKVDLTKFRRSL